MSDFSDANVDKDLLNQIFADEGEDFGADADAVELGLDGVDLEAAQDGASGDGAAVDGAAGADDVKETYVSEDGSAPEDAAEQPEDADGGEDLGVYETEVEDLVNDEARKVMDEERLSGTVTVITENTTINGSISSDGSLEVMGIITGDIECLGKVYVNGTVSGGVVASEIFVNTPKLQGGLKSEGTVKISIGTMIIGDVSGTSAYIAGAVKGNIDINGPVIVESTAVVKGDIKAKSITINSGAVVDGYCSINYAGVDLDKFFDEE